MEPSSLQDNNSLFTNSSLFNRYQRSSPFPSSRVEMTTLPQSVREKNNSDETSEEKKRQTREIFSSSKEEFDASKSVEICFSEEEKPRDRFHLVLVAAYLFGVASLLPWNFFITANDYWMYKFRNVSIEEEEELMPDHRTSLQTTFTSYLSIASTVPILLSHLVNTAASHRISPTIRMGVPLAISIVIIIITAILVKMNTDNDQTVFFIVTICTAVIINGMGAFLQGVGIGIAGCLPDTYMRAFVNGQASGGIFATLAQILSLVSDPHPTDSALAYFLCATFTLGLTGVFFVIMLKTDFYRYYMGTQIVGDPRKVATEDKVSLVYIFKKIWPFAVSLFLLFTMTLSVFPGLLVLTVSMTPHESIFTNRLFLPIACFLSFNLGDLSGRLVGGWLTLSEKKSWMIVPLSIIHMAFIPLLMLCNAQPRHHLPVVFGNDAFFIAFIILLAFSNGHLCSVLLIRGPKRVTAKFQQSAGTMMAAFQGAGLMAGSVMSYGLVKLL